MSRWFSFGSLCLSSLTLISCGNGASPFAWDTNPCQLITAAEAEAALGEPAQEGQRADSKKIGRAHV